MARDDKLSKLILMLSSDQPGEVAAAARAIGRELTATGRDWHWLAAAVNSGASPSGPSTMDDERGAVPSRAWCFSVVIELCVNHLNELNQREVNFVVGMRDRLAAYGSKTRVSPKQALWIRSIWRRVQPGSRSRA